MKQQFRNKDGCCICATKSSTTRFQPSEDFEAAFFAVFGAKARHRSGVICNACVLCVKRGGSGTSRQSGKLAPYTGVVDSRKGTGPKHMKQICKRNRRREQREAAVKATTANKQLAMGGSVAAACGESADNAASGSSVPAGSSCGSGGSSSTSSGTAGIEGAGNFVGNANGLAAGGSGDKSLSASTAGSGVGASGGSGAAGSAGGAAATSTPSGGAEFRAPMAPPTSERQHYYKKRVIMKPIKTPDTQQEISDLFDAVIRSRKLNPSEGPLSVQQVHSAFLNTKRRRMMAASNGSETASVGSTEPPESFTSDTGSSDTARSCSSGQRL